MLQRPLLSLQIFSQTRRLVQARSFRVASGGTLALMIALGACSSGRNFTGGSGGSDGSGADSSGGRDGLGGDDQGGSGGESLGGDGPSSGGGFETQAECGDGKVEGDEACDGNDVDHATCTEDCDLDCAGNYADCDGDGSNGCETHLRSDSQHCGACDYSCWRGDCALSVCSSFDPGITEARTVLVDGDKLYVTYQYANSQEKPDDTVYVRPLGGTAEDEIEFFSVPGMRIYHLAKNATQFWAGGWRADSTGSSIARADADGKNMSVVFTGGGGIKDLHLDGSSAIWALGFNLNNNTDDGLWKMDLNGDKDSAVKFTGDVDSSPYGFYRVASDGTTVMFGYHYSTPGPTSNTYRHTSYMSKSGGEETIIDPDSTTLDVAYFDGEFYFAYDDGWMYRWNGDPEIEPTYVQSGDFSTYVSFDPGGDWLAISHGTYVEALHKSHAAPTQLSNTEAAFEVKTDGTTVVWVNDHTSDYEVKGRRLPYVP